MRPTTTRLPVAFAGAADGIGGLFGGGLAFGDEDPVKFVGADMGLGADVDAAENVYNQLSSGHGFSSAAVLCSAAGAFAGSYGSAVGMTAESMKASFKAGRFPLMVASSSYWLASSPTNLVPCWQDSRADVQHRATE
jgi:hypothetical protein